MEESTIVNRKYPKASKYTDLHRVYSECSGPGALKLTEFLSEKMTVQPEDKLLDVGTNGGYQTCFIAKEYNPFIVGIDPWGDSIDRLMQNARDMGVERKIIGMKIGVPNTPFASESFDKIISTTTLEMIRGMNGETGYKESVMEIYRLLKPGGIFGLGEPMHNDVEIPREIYPYVTKGNMPAPWTECFATLKETVEVLESVGFKIVEADEAPDAQLWWEEYCEYDSEAGDDGVVIAEDKGRWTTFGYIIAEK